jgi:twinkle protein
MRASDISRLLGAQAESVVRELLPQGKRAGHEWKVGSLSGEPGDSLAVHLTGDKAGVWSDFSTGDKGDFIGLWMAVRNCTLQQACSDALALLGISEERPVRRETRAYSKPTREGVSPLSPAHASWLRDVRKLPDESVAAYKLASRGNRVMFPYLLGGELVAAKYRKDPQCTPKEQQFSADSDCEQILFGWQAITPRMRAVCITEGELDAIAMHAYGFPSLSVPTGASAHGWLEREYDRLERFDTIYLAMDDDAVGRKAIPELVERLGRERCKLVKLPRKDANACLMDGVPRDDVIEAMRGARTQDPDELRNVGDFEDEVMSEYERVDEGLLLPWAKTHADIRLRPGETSVWAGYSGHGKSALLSFIFGFLAVQGVKCCVASMEFRTSLWLMRMNRQIAGVAKPTNSFGRAINRKLAASMFAFNVAGRAKAQRILEVFRYARRRYQVELFMIDNLTKCGFADDDFSGQKAFVEEISDWCRETGAHVAILAHMKKGQSQRGEDPEDRPGGKFGVKGSGGIVDMCDTQAEVWRNKPLERAKKALADTNAKRAQSGEEPLALDEKYAMQSDTLVLIRKQRATGLEPVVHLWYDPTTTQFLSGPSSRPQSLMPFSVVENGAAA